MKHLKRVYIYIYTYIFVNPFCILLMLDFCTPYSFPKCFCIIIIIIIRQLPFYFLVYRLFYLKSNVGGQKKKLYFNNFFFLTQDLWCRRIKKILNNFWVLSFFYIYHHIIYHYKTKTGFFLLFRCPKTEDSFMKHLKRVYIDKWICLFHFLIFFAFLTEISFPEAIHGQQNGRTIP